MVYICFLAIAMLAASPQCGTAADTTPSSERRTVVVCVDPHSGRLIQTVRGAGAPKPAPKQITDLVEQAARAHDVDPLLVHSIIQVESNYDQRAVSAKGAQGLMQLMPATARMLGVSDSLDPRENIEAGVKYLKYLQNLYKDDRLALAAYNAGPGAVEKYKQVPPYRETRNYVDEVGRKYNQARKAAAVQAAPAAPAVLSNPAALSNIVEEQHPNLEQFIDENGRLHLRTVQ